MIISSLSLSELIQLTLEIVVILFLLWITVAILFKLLKPILRLFFMDKLVGDNSLDLKELKYKHLFYKFYIIESGRGKLLFYIGDKNKKLDDGKRITERFFVFRKKDNLMDCNYGN